MNSENFILIDSSFDFENFSFKSNSRIITFDFKSHKILQSKNIVHEKSDNFLKNEDFEKIRNSSFVFSKWFDEEDISSVLTYKGVNLGQIYYPEFHHLLVPILKKFLEIQYILKKFPDSHFSSSGILYDILKNLTIKCTRIKDSDSVHEFLYDSINVPLKLGGFSKNFHFSRETYGNIKNFSDKIINKFFHPENFKNNQILFVEADAIKYKDLFLSFPFSNIYPICYNRRRPTIWNKESFSIIRKSHSKIITSQTLREEEIKQNLQNDVKNFEKNLENLDDEYMSTFFSLNSHSFWKIIKPLFLKLGKKRIRDGIFETNLAIKLLDEYHFKAILLWSEHGFSEQIIIQLANLKNIPIILVQHGLYYDTPEAIEFNEFVGIFPNQSDHIIAWGNILSDYASECGIPKNKIQVLGNPIYDSLFKIDDLEDQNYVLLATPPITKNYVDDLKIKTQENFEDAVKTVCEAAKKLGMGIIIKPHPFIGDFDLEKLVNDIDPKIPIIRNSSITPLIKSCSVLVTFEISTVLLESQILKKPTISIDIKDQLFGIPKIISSKSCFSTNITNFENTLIKIQNDSSFKKSLIENGTTFIQNYLTNCGNSIKEHLKFLENFEQKNSKNLL